MQLVTLWFDDTLEYKLTSFIIIFALVSKKNSS